MTNIARNNGKLFGTSSAGIAIAMMAIAGHHAHARDAEEAGGQTSEIIIINNDGPDEGLNDPTPVEPVDGNMGTTLGEQRLNVFEAAVRVWEGILVSDVPIEFEAQFDELFCDETSATLGSAGPLTAAADFTGAQLPDTLYVGAQANQQAGFDLDPDSADLSARFNSLLGTGPECLGGLSFYLGIDGELAPEGTIGLFDTILHEIAHGVGFLSLVDDETGERFLDTDDIFSRNLQDDTLGLNWPDLNDAERVASAINTGNLQWNGKIARFCAGRVLNEGAAGDGDVLMFAPDPVEPGSSVSHFDRSLTPDELMEPNATPTSILDLTVAAFADMGWPISKKAAKRLCRPMHLAAE